MQAPMHVAVLAVCVFLYHLITTEPDCGLCVLCVLNDGFIVLTNNICEKFVMPLDSQTSLEK